MKTIILNGITAKKSLNFENKVKKLLPEGVKELYLSLCGMTWQGRGSYNYFLDFSINGGVRQTLTSFTHNSEAWDNWQDIEAGTVKHDNFNKNVCLMILEENQNQLKEMFNQ